MDLQVDHLMKREKVESKLPQKIAHGLGRGIFSKETEYGKEYPGYTGDVDPNLKVPDHINFGDRRFFQPAMKEHYPGYEGEQRIIPSSTNTHGLKMAIKKDGKFGHLFKGKEEAQNKYDRPQACDSGVEKPDKWIKGVLNRPVVPFYNKTTTGQHYRGHSQDFAQKQNERFDTLRSPKPINMKDSTNYREKHNTSKSPDIWKVANNDQNTNKVYDRTTTHPFKNPDIKNNSAYKRDYSSNINRTDYGSNIDPKLPNLLKSFHDGYYYN